MYSQGATGLLAEYVAKNYHSQTAEDLTKAQEEKEKQDSTLKHVLYHLL